MDRDTNRITTDGHSISEVSCGCDSTCDDDSFYIYNVRLNRETSKFISEFDGTVINAGTKRR